MHTSATSKSITVDKKRPVQDRQFVTALARGLKILACFRADRPELTGSEIARLTGLPQPTVWRLCHTMLKEGVLIGLDGEKMRPGLAVLQLGYSALSGLDAIDLARPHMQEIADEFSAACGMAATSGINMVFVERCQGKNSLLMNLRVGSSIPIATTALGWAYLAALPREQRAAAIDTIALESPDVWNKMQPYILTALKDYETHGYVVSEGTFHKAYNTVAVPIIAPDGSVPYALNCGSTSTDMDLRTATKLVAPRLIKLANALRNALALNS